MRIPLLLSLALAAAFLAPASAATPDPARITVNVLVLNYDPALPSQGGVHLRQHMKWNDPRPMTEHLARYITEASGGYAKYHIVEFIDLDAFPQKRDGFRYTGDTFLDMWKDKDKKA